MSLIKNQITGAVQLSWRLFRKRHRSSLALSIRNIQRSGPDHHIYVSASSIYQVLEPLSQCLVAIMLLCRYIYHIVSSHLEP